MAKVATRAGAQQVFDIEYLVTETGSDTFDSFEILELFLTFFESPANGRAQLLQYWVCNQN